MTVQRLRQVHGAEVVVVDGTTADGRPPEADAVIGAGTGSCLVVLTADCAPVALGSPEGIHGAVHVGWRGLEAGVIARAVDVMRGLGASEVVAGLGPTIHPCCYRFSPEDLEAVAAVVGDEVRGVTTDGGPALDLPGFDVALGRELGLTLTRGSVDVVDEAAMGHVPMSRLAVAAGLSVQEGVQ